MNYFMVLLVFDCQVGFNMKKVTKGNVTIKLWDLGGQPRFRSMWERYCRAVSAIVYATFFSHNLSLSFYLNDLFGSFSKIFIRSIDYSTSVCWKDKELIFISPRLSDSQSLA